MTATVLPTTRRRDSRTHDMPRLTFAGTLRSELHKTWSVPAVRWLVVLAAPATALGTISAAQFAPGLSVATGEMFGAAVVALLAGLAIAGEYANGSIRTTFTSAPRRAKTVAAKSLAIAVIGLVSGWLGALVGAAVNGDLPAAVLPVLATGSAVAAAGVLGLSLGALIRRVAPTAIVTLFGVFLAGGLIGGVAIGGVSPTEYMIGDSSVALVMGTDDWVRPLVTVLAWVGVTGAAALVRIRSTDV